MIYSPENIIYQEKTADTEEAPRRKIISKHCAASALDDNLVTIKHQTLVAALKQGMTAETKVIALCDGVTNCWNVVQELEGRCHSITRILDWFYITKRFQNISLPKDLAEKLEHIKWCIWHGQAEKGLARFDAVIDKVSVSKMKERVTQLKGYLENNKSYLVNYEERYSAKQAISSSTPKSEHLALVMIGVILVLNMC